MTYIRILEADGRLELESLTNELLTETRGKVRGYSIHPTTGIYSCLVEFMGEHSYDNQRRLEPQELKTLESEVMLDLIRRNDYSEEFQQQYGISDCEAVRKHNLYEKVRGTEVGKRVSLEDIKTQGYQKAAELQQLDSRKFKETNGFSWKDLAEIFKISKSPLDYKLLANRLGLNLEDIYSIDRKVRHVLNSKSRIQKRKRKK